MSQALETSPKLFRQESQSHGALEHGVQGITGGLLRHVPKDCGPFTAWPGVRAYDV